MFETSGVRGPYGEAMTVDLALDIGRAVATDGAERVVIGRDARLTGSVLVDAVATGIRECGGDVIDLGVVATPTVARSIAWQEADVGVSVTASHNPPEDNGIKLWTPSGLAFDAEQRDRIESIVRDGSYTPVNWDQVGDRWDWDGAVDRHVDAICSSVEVHDPPSVIVDLGTGVGAVTVRALRQLGCHVETLNEGSDGRFPARPSEPNAANCETLASVVAATDADLGIAHDGDADRMMAVDESGRFLSGDVLLAIFGRGAVEDGGVITAPVNTSLAVDDHLVAVDGAIDRTKVGDVAVAERARDIDAAFAGEPSGTWIWPAETLCPDGSLAAVKVVELVSETGASLGSIADSVERYPIRRDNRRVPDKHALMEAVTEAVTDRYDDVNTLDGVRVNVGDGWFLIRASGTEPLVRITAEARSDERADELATAASAVIIEQLEERTSPIE